MDEKQINTYINIQKELDSIKPKKYKLETRKIYKRYCLKVVKILIENNIQITGVTNAKNEHLKKYAAIEMEKGRKIKNIISELRGFAYWHTALNHSKDYTRYTHLLDLRILEKYLQQQQEVENEN